VLIYDGIRNFCVFHEIDIRNFCRGPAAACSQSLDLCDAAEYTIGKMAWGFVLPEDWSKEKKPSEWTK